VPWQLDWDHTGFSRRLMGQLSAIGGGGYELELCSSGEDKDYGSFRNRRLDAKVIEGVGEDPLAPILNSIAFSMAFADAAAKESHDLIHCFNTTSHFLGGRKFLLQLINPTSAFVKDMIASEYPAIGKYQKKLEAYNFAAALEERECEGAERVIVTSSLAKGNVAKYYGRREGVEAIPSGVDPSIIEQDYVKQKNKLKIILYPNRISVTKGFRYMPRAMEIIRKEFPSSVLLVTGREDSFDLEAVSGDIKRLRDMGCITIAGFLGRGALMNYYKMADVVAVPSLCDDMSLSLLDAVAMATPVVATENSGFPQVDDVGIRVPPKDSEAFAEAVIRLLSDDDLYAKKMENAKKVIRGYLWPEIGKKYREIYSKALG